MIYNKFYEIKELDDPNEMEEYIDALNTYEELENAVGWEHHFDD